MNSVDTLVPFVRTFLRMQSDNTFLSSIDYIDFTHRVVSIKNGYWKTFIGFISWKFSLPKPDIGRICKLMKNFWIDRFSECSATKIKNFILGKISSSFFNFKNILYYGFDFFLNGNPNKKNMKRLRLTRYYEKKAKRFYLRSLNLLKQPVELHTAESVNIEPIHESDEELDPILDIIEEDRLSDNVVNYSEEEYEFEEGFDIRNELNLNFTPPPLSPEPEVTISQLPLDFSVPINESESLPVSLVVTVTNTSDDVLSSIDNVPNSSSYFPGQIFD